MKLGFFGGSFDPIHFGHLIMAECCRERAQLDRILFVPAAQSPLKPAGPCASNKQRVEMIQLAIAGNDHFELSMTEIDRGGVSFTVDSLQLVASQYSNAELYLLMGADSLQDFSKWKEPQGICELAIPLVVARRGSNADLQQLKSFVSDARLSQIEDQQIHCPAIEISSTDIRRDIRQGRSIRYRLPRGVEKFVETHRLYVEGDTM